MAARTDLIPVVSMQDDTDLRAAYQKALTDLDLSADRLEEEMDNLHHELRRIKDALERVGGGSRELQQRAKQLADSIGLCERDLEQNRSQANALSEKLRALGRSDGDDG